VSISVDLAHRVLGACKQRARELRSPVSIAIVDASGHLVLFERMMAPYGWATGNISIAKANTSVMFNQATDAIAQWASAIPGFAASLSAMTDGKFIMAAGGWPIRINGITVGGIGISGGNAPGRDDEIARAGLSAVAIYSQQSLPAARPTVPVSQPIPTHESIPQAVYPPIQNHYNGHYPFAAQEAAQQKLSNSTDTGTTTNDLLLDDKTNRSSIGESPSTNKEQPGALS
jgi:uncharacterized protein GlcG (DUF336 family)